MSLRFRQFGAACVLALALSRTAFAQQDEEKTPLGKKMSAMNTALKAIGRQIDDPAQNAATLEQIAVIETNAKAAMALEPAKKEKVPAGDQAKFMAGYKDGMKQLLATLDQMKVAVKAGKNADAAKLLDELKKEQKDGHAEYRLKKAGAPGGH